MREVKTHKSVRIVQYIKILKHVNVFDLVFNHTEQAVTSQQLGYVAITDSLFYRPEGDVRPCVRCNTISYWNKCLVMSLEY